MIQEIVEVEIHTFAIKQQNLYSIIIARAVIIITLSSTLFFFSCLDPTPGSIFLVFLCYFVLVIIIVFPF